MLVRESTLLPPDNVEFPLIIAINIAAVADKRIT